MASVSVRPSVGGNHVHVSPSSSGAHVSVGAGQGASAVVKPGQPGPWHVVIYDSPGARTGAFRSNNPGLAAVLRGVKMEAVVTDYTAKVRNSYLALLGPRSKSGDLAGTVQATVIPNSGYSRDRWVGEVTVGSAAAPYGAADEFGRKSPDDKQRGSTTDGSNNLRTALYSVLPYPL